MLYSHARWLYLIAARAEDLPMPEGFCGLLPSDLQDHVCISTGIHAGMFTCIYLSAYLPIYVTTHLPTFDLSICFQFAQVLLCLVPIHPYIHDMSCNFNKA